MPILKSDQTALTGQKLPAGTPVTRLEQILDRWLVETAKGYKFQAIVKDSELDPDPPPSSPPNSAPTTGLAKAPPIGKTPSVAPLSKPLAAKADATSRGGTTTLRGADEKCASSSAPKKPASVPAPKGKESKESKKSWTLTVDVQDDDHLIIKRGLTPWKLEGATVKVTQGETEAASGTTPKNGQLKFTLPEGEYLVSADLANYDPLASENWKTPVNLTADATVVRTLVPKVRVIEAGAGSGAFSESFQSDFKAIKYYSTDIRPQTDTLYAQTSTEPAVTFLGTITESQKMRPIWQVNANQLGSVFENGVADVIVGVNNYGSDPKDPPLIPLASYGLACYPVGFVKKDRKKRFWGMEPDARFLQSCMPILKKDGRVVLRCKSNILAIVAQAKFEEKKITPDELNALQALLASHNKTQGLDDQALLAGINQFAQTDIQALNDFARLGFMIEIRATGPPPGVVGKAADTGSGSKRRTDVSPYNTELIFRKGAPQSVHCYYGSQKLAWPVK